MKVLGPPTGRRGDHLREGLVCVEAEGDEFQVGRTDGCRDLWTRGGRSLSRMFRIVCATCDLQHAGVRVVRNVSAVVPAVLMVRL